MKAKIKSTGEVIEVSDKVKRYYETTTEISQKA
jgi:hypothetical protein